MVIKQFVVSMFATNCYLVFCKDTLKGIVIDPGGGEDKILKTIKEIGLKIEFIVNTHGHPDHTLGNNKIKSVTGAKIAIHKDDAPMLGSTISKIASLATFRLPKSHPDLLLTENYILTFGNISFKIIHTPGHSPGGICLLGTDVVFTGDTLFAGSIGRTDIIGGSYKSLMKSIKEKLINLPDSIRVYPGHGELTTIKIEKKHNPFLFELLK